VPDEWIAVVKALGLDAKIPAAKISPLYSNELVDCMISTARKSAPRRAASKCDRLTHP